MEKEIADCTFSPSSNDVIGGRALSFTEEMQEFGAQNHAYPAVLPGVLRLDSGGLSVVCVP